ncbi:arginyl-tRNA synthetase [Altibacter lentus]|uniref:arginyl-tRNA synthetase n=1 Tax=Altibacter lentus TaxID=1223410 RepID=UPI0005580D1C|nr:arginyl-tRNA synthetase [Altibacter lentus]
MILNVSYNNKAITKQIDEELGKPFTLKERIKQQGIGSPRLVITDCSLHLHNLLILDSNRNVCNIELRPKGIIVGFRSLLESYALVIPFYKLVLYKGKAEEYSVYRDDYYVKVLARSKDTAIHAFMLKVLNAKAKALPTRLEDP